MRSFFPLLYKVEISVVNIKGQTFTTRLLRVMRISGGYKWSAGLNSGVLLS